VFFGDKLVESYQSEVREIAQPDRNYYAQAWKTFGDISFEEVASYFIGSGFRDNLIAYIGLSDEDFAPQEIYRVDFRATPPSVQLCDEPQLQQIHNETGARVTYARIRTPAFVETIRNLLPWEDLLIGFQARFDRVPNVYDSDFWYHFTNVHIKQRARRAIADCGGSCSRISEAVF
jgi:CMP-N-acetylneuraminate monooxygenase